MCCCSKYNRLKICTLNIQVIAVSRDSAKSVRFSTLNVSPSKMFYSMSVKAVRMGMENIVLNVLFSLDILCNLYQIILIDGRRYDDNESSVPSNVEYWHLMILYFIQIFLMILCIQIIINI